MKKIIRLTESDLHRIINESVKRMINEIGDENDVEQDDFYDEQEEYNPFLNGKASWLNGEYDTPYGFHVEIDSSMGTVSIEDMEQGEENSYFLQGDEADDLIVKMCQYWDNHEDETADEVVNYVISHEGY